MTVLRFLPLLFVFSCSNFWSERRDKALAIAAKEGTSDAAALSGVANTCFTVATVKGKRQLSVGKLESGGYRLSVVSMGLALTQSRTVEHAKKNLQNALAREVQCALSAARGRKLEDATVSLVVPVGEGVRELYRVKATVAALDRLDGWESLDPTDFDDMQKLWSAFEVVKEDFADLEVR